MLGSSMDPKSPMPLWTAAAVACSWGLLISCRGDKKRTTHTYTYTYARMHIQVRCTAFLHDCWQEPGRRRQIKIRLLACIDWDLLKD